MHIAKFSRTSVTMLATAGILVSLVACSAPTETVDPDCDTTPSGSVSDSVKVTGDFLKEPTVDFDIPLTAPKATERTVVISGDGDTVKEGDTVNVLFSIFSGSSSADIAGVDWSAGTTTAFPLDDTLLPGLQATLVCSKVGSRVVGVIPPADAFGDTGSTDLGISSTDAIVFVVDIESIKPAAEPALPKADGVDQAPVEGLPTVVLADDGRPTVTIPDTAPPTELQLAVLKKGDGEVVADGADVTVHYQGINWDTKEIFDESWGGDPATFNTSGVIAGFTQALVGQTVGSQVLVVIPPSLGYGEKSDTNTNALAGQTLVFVIDILGIG